MENRVEEVLRVAYEAQRSPRDLLIGGINDVLSRHTKFMTHESKFCLF